MLLLLTQVLIKYDSEEEKKIELLLHYKGILAVSVLVNTKTLFFSPFFSNSTQNWRILHSCDAWKL